MKENKGRGEVDSEYNSLCKWEVAIKDENRDQIVEIIIRGKKPKQDVSKEWNCSLHTEYRKSVLD